MGQFLPQGQFFCFAPALFSVEVAGPVVGALGLAGIDRSPLPLRPFVGRAGGGDEQLGDFAEDVFHAFRSFEFGRGIDRWMIHSNPLTTCQEA